MRPLLASYKEVPPGIIFSTKEKCLDDLTECSSRKTSVTGQFIASWTFTRPVLTSPSTRKLNSTREVLWSRGWDSDCYNQAREKVQDAKGSSPPPPPPRPPPPVPPPRTRPYWLKMSHCNLTTFTLKYTVNVNEIFFAENCDTQR